MEVAVSLEAVSKCFTQRQRPTSPSQLLRSLLQPRVRRVQALDQVSLTVRPGEILAYAGPNGAGKSTTVKLLCSLLAPDSGSVRVLGKDPLRERTSLVTRIGVVFGQRTELWWDHSVEASFEWKRVVWGIPQDHYAAALSRLRPLLDLDPFLHTAARELSLGQRMRADLAMALLHQPELLLLDEPTLGLDVLAKRHVLEFVRELNREAGVTVIVTSHDMSDLEQLAGRIVMLHLGRVAFDGDFLDLRRLLPDSRRLLLETASPTPPTLTGALLVGSDSGRHEYTFDASATTVGALLDQASSQAELLDVETHRPPIDEVIASIFERWQSTATP